MSCSSMENRQDLDKLHWNRHGIWSQFWPNCRRFVTKLNGIFVRIHVVCFTGYAFSNEWPLVNFMVYYDAQVILLWRHSVCRFRWGHSSFDDFARPYCYVYDVNRWWIYADQEMKRENWKKFIKWNPDPDLFTEHLTCIYSCIVRILSWRLKEE